MPAKWERVYLGMLYVLLAAVAALFFWDIMTTNGWRVRSAFIFVIGWGIAVRVGAKWIPSRLTASLHGWLARGRLHVFCFNLLWFGVPFGIFAYLARWHSRLEMLTIILLASLMPLLFMRPSERNTESNAGTGGTA
jgi:hypothetical protein